MPEAEGRARTQSLPSSPSMVEKGEVCKDLGMFSRQWLYLLQCRMSPEADVNGLESTFLRCLIILTLIKYFELLKIVTD